MNDKNIMLPCGSQLWSADYAEDVLSFAGNFHVKYGDKVLGLILCKAAGHVSNILYGETRLIDKLCKFNKVCKPDVCRCVFL